jgi:hypothetical protein|tara:strand:- start:69 stop:383 length:315 start_codon:yes stop_codon:yes gene_type:complete
MKAYSDTKPNLTHSKNGITYLNCNAVEETIPADEVTGQEERTQWVYDSVPVQKGNLVAAGIRARYSWDDEIALINNHNLDSSDPDGEYAEYQAYRASVKNQVAV